MSAALTLTQMADLALGTPEVGAVNFNVLHSLLHAMIQKLGIADVKSEIPKTDKDFLTRKRDDPDAFSTAGTDISDRDSTVTGLTDDSGYGGKSANSSKRSPYHHLEDKVANLEKQFSELNNLPSNQSLYNRSKTKGEGEKPTPVSDMWQAMQLKTKVEANEDGIGKLMSLVQDLMHDMQTLKDDMQGIKDENKDIRKQLEDVKDMDELMKRLKALEDYTKELNDRLAELPGPEKFNDYVSWAALEDALKGLRDNLEELNNRELPAPEQRVVIEMSSQTTPHSSRPNSSRPASSRPGSSRSRGPSEELQMLLERLGKLTDKHDKLEVRVDDIEDELKNKLDKSALEGLNLGVPEDLLEKLKGLQEEIDRLKKSVGRIEAIEAVVMDLQAFEQSDLPPIPASMRSITPVQQPHSPSPEYVSTESSAHVKPSAEYVSTEPSGHVKPPPPPHILSKSTEPPAADSLSPLVVADAGASHSSTLVPVGSGVLPVVSRRSVRDDTFKAFTDKIGQTTEDLQEQADTLSKKHSTLNVRMRSEIERLEDEIRALKERLNSKIDALENTVDELDDKVSGVTTVVPPAVEPTPPPGYRTTTPPPEYTGSASPPLPPIQTSTSKPSSAENLHRTPSTPSTPPRIPSAAETIDPSLLREMQLMVARNTSMIDKQKNKLKMLTQESNRELGDTKDKIRGVDKLLQVLGDRMDALGDMRKRSLTSTSTFGPEAGVASNESTIVVPQETTPAPVQTTGLAPVPVKPQTDNEAFQRMQQNIANLQSELQRLDKATQKLMDQNDNQQSSIDELYKLCSQLEEHKADKEYVQTEVEVKADKRLVDGKVNRTLFDSTCEDLNKMINDILSKLAASDDDWKKMLAQLNEDLDGKLDRLEFGPIKDELEKQLRALAKRLKDMNREYEHFEDDAAGIRKQLIQRFHCISCDRPVDMMPQGPVPSIPNPNALPATRSARPYTTFELEQIRQHAKSYGAFPDKLFSAPPMSAPPMLSNGLVNARELAALDTNKKMSNFERAILENRIARCHMHDLRSYLVHFGRDFGKFNLKGAPLKPVSQPGGAEVMDAYQTSRSCGGSHTLTYPHRRTTRTTHINEYQQLQTSVEQQKQIEHFWSRKSNVFRDDTEVTIIPPQKGEVDIQGADGHIYRGRSRGLPNLPSGSMSNKNHPMLPKRAQTSMEPHNNTPPLMSPRPTSARLSRPTSARPTSRPQSANGHEGVTLPRENGSPPPGPAPSEPDSPPQENSGQE